MALQLAVDFYKQGSRSEGGQGPRQKKFEKELRTKLQVLQGELGNSETHGNHEKVHEDMQAKMHEKEHFTIGEICELHLSPSTRGHSWVVKSMRSYKDTFFRRSPAQPTGEAAVCFESSH